MRENEGGESVCEKAEKKEKENKDSANHIEIDFLRSPFFSNHGLALSLPRRRCRPRGHGHADQGRRKQQRQGPGLQRPHAPDAVLQPARVDDFVVDASVVVGNRVVGKPELRRRLCRPFGPPSWSQLQRQG